MMMMTLSYEDTETFVCLLLGVHSRTFVGGSMAATWGMGIQDPPGDDLSP